MFAIGNFAPRRFATAAALMMASAAPAAALELVMFERAGCVWCARWDREVGPVYARTGEGRTAPLRRVDLDRSEAALPALALPVRYTPTFVLIDEGREIGRITGYLGDDAFWGLLGKMLAGMDKPIHRTGGLSAIPEKP